MLPFKRDFIITTKYITTIIQNVHYLITLFGIFNE